MNSSPLKKTLILVAMLVLPGFLYYLLKEGGKNRYRPLAIFGPKVVAGTFHSVRGKQIPDTIYHQVADFRLADQHGDTVSFANFKNQILLVNLFYTSADRLAIEKANQTLHKFANDYLKNDIISFLSISVDERDHIAVLKSYADSLRAPKNWYFLSGSDSATQRLATKGLLLNLVQQGDNQKLTFGNAFVLLDTEHRIRGFYDVTNDEAKSKLEDEIKVLIAEEFRNVKDGR